MALALSSIFGLLCVVNGSVEAVCSIALPVAGVVVSVLVDPVMLMARSATATFVVSSERIDTTEITKARVNALTAIPPLSQFVILCFQLKMSLMSF